jgi:hypothetical protein
MGKVHVFKNYFITGPKTLSFTLQEYRQMNPVDMIYHQHLLTNLEEYKVRATQAVLGLFKCIRLGRHTQKATRYYFWLLI